MLWINGNGKINGDPLLPLVDLQSYRSVSGSTSVLRDTTKIGRDIVWLHRYRSTSSYFREGVALRLRPIGLHEGDQIPEEFTYQRCFSD